jgi:quinol monooxygenase YgiN
MFALVVRFYCRDEHAAADFDALTAATVEKIRKYEPGTLVYAVHRVEGQPLQRIFYELYQDRAAFNTHETQEYIKEFLEARGSFIASYDVDFLTPTIEKRVLD